MREINLSNDKKRDARVGLESGAKKAAVRFVLPDGRERRNVKFVKTTCTAASLLKQHGDLLTAGRALIAHDGETDMETVGRLIARTYKLYLNPDNSVAYRVNLVQAIYNPDGSEKEQRELAKAQANISGEIPLQWTGRKFPKAEAVRRFVFTRSYQIHHTNGLTYDFLHNMAKQLAEADALMFVGAGKKGSDPIVLSSGGEPYRGFLEGRVDGGGYLLILHLTNLELKPLPGATEAKP
jgi:hypothetical protein